MTPALPRRALLGLAATAALPALAQRPASQAPALPPGERATLPGAELRDWTDPASARSWRIWLQPPEGPAPAGGYPVLYALDGNASFALAAQLARNAAARPQPLRPDPVLVVGIGHPLDAVFTQPLRTRDYTPASASLPANATQGGGDVLLDFIVQTLRPALAQRWPLDARRQTLFGHSFGGLLALHSLFTRPGDFTRYAAASPSIWWDGSRLLARCDDFIARYAPAPRPFALQLEICAGSLEVPPAAANAERAEIQERRRTHERAAALAEKLQALAWPELAVRFTTLAGQDHGSVMAPALIDALALAQRPA